MNSGTASPYSGTASDTVPARFDVVPALRMFQRLNVPEWWFMAVPEHFQAVPALRLLQRYIKRCSCVFVTVPAWHCSSVISLWSRLFQRLNISLFQCDETLFQRVLSYSVPAHMTHRCSSALSVYSVPARMKQDCSSERCLILFQRAYNIAVPERCVCTLFQRTVNFIVPLRRGSRCSSAHSTYDVSLF